MLPKGIPLPGVPALRISAPGAAVMIGIVLLTAPSQTLAQHGGGGHGGAMSAGGPTGAGGGRPSGVSEKDDLKDFHRALAVQATAQQSAAFAIVVQDTQAASAQLQSFKELLQKALVASALSDQAATLDLATEKARTSNQSFLASFSSAQKSGLKDNTKRLAKVDSALTKQMKALDQVVQTPKPETEPIASSASSFDKALADFQTEQLALGREMGIILPSGQDLTFNLPPATSSINIGGQPISIAASGAVSRTSATDGNNLFNLQLVADLSDLQQNITSILRSQLAREPRCGERIEIQQATLIPLPPAGLVAVHLHLERWMCPPIPGRESPTELATGDVAFEVKLTPSVEPNSSLRLVSEIVRVDADGLLGELLRGSLGDALRDRITASLLSAVQRGADLKATLPSAAQPFATIRKAQFQAAGVGQLNLVLDGQLPLSDEQTKQFAAQLKQQQSAHETSPP